MTGSGPIGPEGVPFGWDAVTEPNIARIYDCWLGGKDNLAVDREVAARVAQVAPLVVAAVRANRAFVRRATAFLAGSGVEQYIDLGSGLPTGENVHEVVGRINPDSFSELRPPVSRWGPKREAPRRRPVGRRKALPPFAKAGYGTSRSQPDTGGLRLFSQQVRVAYVDNDPVVLVHARALLADPARTVVVEGDIRDPEGILADPDLRAHIDFRRPVAVIAAAILHFVTDEQDPARIIRVFRDVMAPGSALVVTHAVEARDDDGGDAGIGEGARIYTDAAAPIVIRSPAQVAAWFDGFRLVPPGLVAADEWRRAGNGRVTAPVVAGVGLLEGLATGTGATGSGAGLARPRDGEEGDG